MFAVAYSCGFVSIWKTAGVRDLTSSMLYVSPPMTDLLSTHAVPLEATVFITSLLDHGDNAEADVSSHVIEDTDCREGT